MTRARPFPLHTGIAEVTAVTEVTPTLARFTLTHPAFADFGVEEPGEIITLGWCDAGEELVLPQLGWRFPAGREQHWRNYTVRAIRPQQAEVDVDFFLHGDVGYASAWAERARPGAPVGFAGPRLHWKGLNGYDWSLLVADETGLPALLAILETLPAGHRSIAIAGADDRQEVATRADVDLRWMPATEIVDAVRDLALPDGPGAVWGGGHSPAMTKIRRHVRAQRTFPRGAVQVLGYW
ncbi:MAG TPA: siderophore-interacting protein [Solirubrobacteraceae bacterium]|nr:siderophore-interacting protein [Solirubrobacteraceae bacterium]